MPAAGRGWLSPTRGHYFGWRCPAAGMDPTAGRDPAVGGRPRCAQSAGRRLSPRSSIGTLQSFTRCWSAALSVSLSFAVSWPGGEGFISCSKGCADTEYMVKQNRAEIITRKRPEHAPAGQRVGGSPAGVGWCPIGETGDPGLIVVFEEGAGPFPASNGHVTWVLMRLPSTSSVPRDCGKCEVP